MINNATLLNIRVNWPRPNCSDNSGNNPVITSNRLSGDLFAVPGSYPVVYTVTDQQNNVNRNCSFSITLKSKYLSISSFISPTQPRLKAGFHYRRSWSRNHKRSRNSAYDRVKIKIGIVSGVIRTTESESEESERFHILLTPFMTPSFTI